jgi:hypothetical protein
LLKFPLPRPRGWDRTLKSPMRRVPCRRASIIERGYLASGGCPQPLSHFSPRHSASALIPPVDYRNIHPAAHPWRLVLGTSLVRVNSRISGPKFQEDQQDRVEEGEREMEGEGENGQNVQSRRVLPGWFSRAIVRGLQVRWAWQSVTATPSCD